MTVNGKNYLEMLHEVVVLWLQTKPNFDELFFQQDGASPYNVLKVRDYPLQTHYKKGKAIKKKTLVDLQIVKIN